MTPAPSLARQDAVRIVETLKGAGYVAYLAGGCVRDELLGFKPKDYDVATDARPEVVRQLFSRTRFVGEAFGVVQVAMHKSWKHPVEVATFRSEWGYEDGRRPTSIHYTDAQHDAQRRDFTINGLFEDPLAPDGSEKIIDFVGGQADLKAGVVRAIGDAKQRFEEDYLRMLRAVRFATRLGFEIEPGTAQAIPPVAKHLARISRERIGQEVMWMLTPGQPPGSTAGGGVDRRSADAIRLIQQLHLDSPALDEEHADAQLSTVASLVEAADTSAVIPKGPPAQPGPPVAYATLLAAWLLDRHFFTGPAQDQTLTEAVRGFVRDRLAPITKRWRKALCLSNDHRDALNRTLGLLPATLGWPSLSIAKQKRLLADTHWPQAAWLVGAMAYRREIGSVIGQLQDQGRQLFEQGVAPTPWVSGDDLIAMGLHPGPRIGKLLEEVYDAQLEGELSSREEAMRWVRGRSEGGA